MSPGAALQQPRMERGGKRLLGRGDGGASAVAAGLARGTRAAAPGEARGEQALVPASAPAESRHRADALWAPIMAQTPFQVSACLTYTLFTVIG